MWRLTGGRELNLLPKEPIESFWDALWLGIQPFLCVDGRMSWNRVGTPTGGRELNLLPKELIESFWDALWLGIQTFLCLDGIM